MPLTNTEKSKRFKQKKRAAGERFLQMWVPGTVFQECGDKVTAIVEEHNAKAKG